MYINFTKHLLERVLLRTKKKNIKYAKVFIQVVFMNLYNSYKTKSKYKNRVVTMNYLEHKKRLITDWKHRFIFSRGLWEVTIITYVRIW